MASRPNQTQLYFGLLPSMGVAEIFIEMFVARNQTQKFVEPCRLVLKQHKDKLYPKLDNPVPYVQAINQRFSEKFRLINWHYETEYLLECLEQHKPMPIWFSTFSPAVFEGIKQTFKQDVVSVAVNYDAKDKSFVLDKWAGWQAGVVVRQEQYNIVDLDQAKQFCLIKGPEYFGYQILESMDYRADIEIHVKELFDENLLRNRLQNLGCECNDESWQFYKQYLINTA
jgi:hypothetical protein